MKEIEGDRRRYAACSGEDRRQQFWTIIKKYCPLSSFIFFYLLLSSFLFACSKGNFTHEAACEAAEGYYTMLVEGNYKGFVGGYADAEAWPKDYRSQLEDATAQFVADNMRSLVSVGAISDSLGEDSTAYVMLGLCFSDSTTEQIEVPLVLTEEGWKMWIP